MSINAQDEQLIKDTLEEYATAYCAKDTDRLMEIFANVPNISIIGTGVDELCAGPQQIRSVLDRNFAEATATKFEWQWLNITIVDKSAAVAVTMNIHLNLDGEAIKVPIRWAIALVKTKDGWKWLHRHASAAAGSQDEGTAYPTDI